MKLHQCFFLLDGDKSALLINFIIVSVHSLLPAIVREVDFCSARLVLVMYYFCTIEISLTFLLRFYHHSALISVGVNPLLSTCLLYR